jgi:uncharacterized protein YndB with AHSA1/START domain
MGRVTSTIDLAYPVDLVWRVATRVEDMPRWMPEVVAAELLDPELATGSRIRLKLGPGTGNAEITGTVKRAEPPTLLQIGGSGGPLSVAVRTALSAQGPSATRATVELEVRTPALLGFIAKEVERRVQAELPAALERLRALLDEEAAAGRGESTPAG